MAPDARCEGASTLECLLADSPGVLLRALPEDQRGGGALDDSLTTDDGEDASCAADSVATSNFFDGMSCVTTESGQTAKRGNESRTASVFDLLSSPNHRTPERYQDGRREEKYWTAWRRSKGKSPVRSSAISRRKRLVLHGVDVAGGTAELASGMPWDVPKGKEHPSLSSVASVDTATARAATPRNLPGDVRHRNRSIQMPERQRKLKSSSVHCQSVAPPSTSWVRGVVSSAMCGACWSEESTVDGDPSV